jgi:hypothetical protein
VSDPPDQGRRPRNALGRGVAHAPAHSALRPDPHHGGGTTRRPSVGSGHSIGADNLHPEYHLQPSSSVTSNPDPPHDRRNLSETKEGRQFSFGVLSPLLSLSTSSRGGYQGGEIGMGQHVRLDLPVRRAMASGSKARRPPSWRQRCCAATSCRAGCTAVLQERCERLRIAVYPGRTEFLTWV